ncbi:YibE/F family protein [Nocardioides sp. SYSU DS0663]|uniref:YibE/F family protein n=1 Tax=Nocardioides sp. SYSU DS0663 TaxID=3416445 RepID=UPI003F4C613D
MAGRHARSTGHAHGHAHGHGAAEVDVRRRPRAVLLGTLAALGIATLVGLVMLWPDGDRAEEIRDDVVFQAPGVTFAAATVQELEGTTATVEIDEGADAGQTRTLELPPEVVDSGVEQGDELRLLAQPSQESGADGELTYTYFGTDRSGVLWALTALLVLVVLAVARWRGLLGLLGLVFAGAVLAGFVLPALLVGESGLAVALVGSALIMYVVLYTTHGFSLRTSAALAGTLAGLAVTAALGVLATGAARLTGVAGEAPARLNSFVPGLDLPGLFTAALVIAGLGVLNDVTITQSSAVWELRAAAPGMSRRTLFGSGMRIGRDHIASTIYTIVFAYAGTALTVLLVLQLYGLPWGVVLTTEDFAEEVVRTLVSSTGLVLAVPITTAIAVWTVSGPVEAV